MDGIKKSTQFFRIERRDLRFFFIVTTRRLRYKRRAFDLRPPLELAFRRNGTNAVDSDGDDGDDDGDESSFSPSSLSNGCPSIGRFGEVFISVTLFDEERIEFIITFPTLINNFGKYNIAGHIKNPAYCK